MFEGNPYGGVTVGAVQELDRQLLALHLTSPLKRALGRYRLEVNLRIRRVGDDTEPVFDTGTMSEVCC